jgi:hypothetical protein
MSTIAHEVRQTLHRQGDAVSPPLDVFAGVERRAHRIRRVRVASVIAGSAIVVAAIAITVPALRTHRGPQAGPAVTAPTSSQPPANVVSWPSRGTLDPTLASAAQASYLSNSHTSAGKPQMTVLDAGIDTAGTHYLLAQMWRAGDATATTVTAVQYRDSTRTVEYDAQTTRDAAAVLFAINSTASSTQTVVIVPRPGLAHAFYSANGSTFVSVATNRDGVAMITRDQHASLDRVRLIDDQGNVFLDESVDAMLCGSISCG